MSYQIIIHQLSSLENSHCTTYTNIKAATIIKNDVQDETCKDDQGQDNLNPKFTEWEERDVFVISCIIGTKNSQHSSL